jgi:6-pyruvoyltetrahydropterin/6-carboxytetrahydropterin synthase
VYSLTIRDHVMVAHSLRGEVFGPAQALHGATFVVDVTFMRQELDRDGIVVDIGKASQELAHALDDLRYRNLDEVPAFAGRNTTTEVLAREVFERVARAIRTGGLGEQARGITSLRVTLTETPSAWASYEAEV